ncbi:DUF1801 domain-containing protein [Lacinutrix neustonica]|uniref:DUF1801 domain-containing protein n=1 Tax=Lacinutrix neustonica TaxID=2980107 RepID=A0A9E8MWX2_9FLAO|nr:DUF1801 domain-containing protein [Lacinutrix neustonica]WAC03172.1 DUF1801 domain-containing protein [Lacinutrix neustonica]
MANDIEEIKKQFSNIKDEQKKQDCFRLLELMQDLTGEPPTLWRGNMIGFGKYQYTNDSGSEGEWFLTGFCPRKQNLVVYIIAGFKNYKPLLSQLGTHETGSSCLYIKSLDTINIEALSALITASVMHMKAKHKL